MWLLLALLVTTAEAVTNCGIGTDPFFATVAFSARDDMWRADAIVTDYDEQGESVQSYMQHHWESRTIDRRCVLHRGVFLPLNDAIYVYQQRIFPASDGAYRIDEYLPDRKQYRTIDCRATRVNATKVYIESEWTSMRLITVVEPHYSYHETVRMQTTDTTTLYTAVPRSQLNPAIVAARTALDEERIEKTANFPFPSLVFEIVE